MNEISLFGIFLSAMIVNNIVLIRFIGLCPFFGVSGKMESAVGMGMAVIFVMTVSSAVTWVIYNYLLVPHDSPLSVYYAAALFADESLAELTRRLSSPSLRIRLLDYRVY